MIRLSLILSLLLCFAFCNAQYRHILIKDTSGYKENSMVVLKAYQQPAVKAYNYLIDPGSLDSSRADIMGTFGTKSDSLRILYFKPEAKLLNINELLTHFHISSKYFDLPIYIDSNIVYHKETSRFQVKTVTSVKIQKEKNTGTKYIMINSIYHVNNPIADVFTFGTFTNPKDGN